MENENFRFLDLEKNSNAAKKVKNPSQEKRPEPKKQKDNELTAHDINHLIDVVDDFKNKIRTTVVNVPVCSAKYTGIEYYPIPDTILVYDSEKDCYIFGGTEFPDMSYTDMKIFVKNNLSQYWQMGKLREDQKYLRDFCDAYESKILDMLKTISDVEAISFGDGSTLKMIRDTVSYYLTKYADDEDLPTLDTTEEETEEFDSDNVSPMQNRSISHMTDESSLSKEIDDESIRQQVEEEDEKMDLSQIAELEPESSNTNSSNLRKYADQIDHKISDEDAMDLIRKAREAKRNRSYQQGYVRS